MGVGSRLRRFSVGGVVVMAAACLSWTGLVAVVPAAAQESTTGVSAVSRSRLHLVYSDDFHRQDLRYHWGPYGGQPGGDPGGWWMPSHITVSRGKLVLNGYRDRGKYATGGLKLLHGLPALKYGKVLVRYRAEPGPYAYAFLLWPSDNSWPPEIDFAEDNGGDRSMITASLHYKAGGRHKVVRRSVKADFTRWHTVGVRWSPGKITYLLDGKAWATVSSARVPGRRMHVALQQQAWPCNHGWYKVCPNRKSPPNRIFVDWIRVWSS